MNATTMGYGVRARERMPFAWDTVTVCLVAALLLVVAIGAAVHRPLSRVPENSLKFVVGVLLSAFGPFWVGEGLGLRWPGEDWSILALIASFSCVSLIAVRLARASRARRIHFVSRGAA